MNMQKYILKWKRSTYGAGNPAWNTFDGFLIVRNPDGIYLLFDYPYKKRNFDPVDLLGEFGTLKNAKQTALKKFNEEVL